MIKTLEELLRISCLRGKHSHTPNSVDLYVLVLYFRWFTVKAYLLKGEHIFIIFIKISVDFDTNWNIGITKSIGYVILQGQSATLIRRAPDGLPKPAPLPYM